MESIKKLVDDLNNSPVPDNVEVVIAPAFIHLYQVLQSIKDPIKVSAQNCWSTPMGAYTGEVTLLNGIACGSSPSIDAPDREERG